ncbi:MAG: hypothetical protein DRN92_08155 [Thermoproteota archaeon]|nr:MAG: hypothetical protein DRN92_08155 [Candidatus Korarchaeota archaeon]
MGEYGYEVWSDEKVKGEARYAEAERAGQEHIQAYRRRTNERSSKKNAPGTGIQARGTPRGVVSGEVPRAVSEGGG